MTDQPRDTVRTRRRLRRLPRLLLCSVVVATVTASISWAFWSCGISFMVHRGSSHVLLIVAGRGCAIHLDGWGTPHEPVFRVFTMRYAYPLDKTYLWTYYAQVHILGVTYSQDHSKAYSYWLFVPTAHCIVVLLLAVGVLTRFRRPRSQAAGFPIELRPVGNPPADAVQK
jgi:hypothetical protein